MILPSLLKMNLKISYCIFFSFILRTGSLSQNLSKQEVVEELQIVQATFEELHPGFTLYRSTPEINLKIDSLNLVIKQSDSLTLREWLFHISEITGFVRCGHTVAYSPTPLSKYFLPFSVELKDIKLYVCDWFDSTIAVPPDYREIVTIDDTPVRDIVNALVQRISTDGYNESVKLFRAQSDFPILYKRYFDCKSTVNLELRSPTGDTIRKAIPAKTKKEKLMNKGGIGEGMAMEINEGGSAYLRLPTFYTKVLKANDIHYKSYIKNFFKETGEKNCEEIIIDIRGNQGGSVHMAGYLASFIIDSTFTFFKSVELKSMDKVTYDHFIQKDQFYRFRHMITRKKGEKRYYTLHRELKPRKPHRLSPQEEVQITVLIDHNTFSAATMFAALLKAKSDVIFVGEGTGGTCIGSGLSPVKLTLPYSGIVVEMPLAYIYLSIQRLQKDELYQGVQPDFSKNPIPEFQ